MTRYNHDQLNTQISQNFIDKIHPKSLRQNCAHWVVRKTELSAASLKQNLWDNLKAPLQQTFIEMETHHCYYTQLLFPLPANI